MAEDDLSGLLNIGFGSDSEPEEAADRKSIAADAKGNSRADRNALSEADFQILKQSYQPKLENGEISKSITIPFSSQTAVSKPEAQELLHAVEELYFFRRYADGVNFVNRVIGEDKTSLASCPLDEETKSLLKYYGERCRQKVGGQ